MERISIELTDDMTLGALRALAEGMGKRLVISLEGRARSARGGRPASGGPVAGRARAAGNGRRRRRRLSPKARAALARNLVKARAARSAKAKAARAGKTAKAQAT